jgi:hypothetical protein
MAGILKNIGNAVSNVSDLLNGVNKIEDVQNKINNHIIDLNLAKEQQRQLLLAKKVNPSEFSASKLKENNDRITEIVKQIRDLKQKKNEKIHKNREELVEEYKEKKAEHYNNKINYESELAKKKAAIKTQARIVLGKNRVIKTGGKSNKKRSSSRKNRRTARK